MNEEEVFNLFERYHQGKCTPEEVAEVESWFNQFERPSATYGDVLVLEASGKAVWAKLDAQFPRKRQVPAYLKYAAAVAAIVFGVWFYNSSYLNGRHPDAGQDPALVQQDIAPGRNGATITLASGKVIQLSGAKMGVIVGKDLKYNDNTPLSSQGGSLPEGERSMMLTASTARGQTYQFTLPDGTKVWLNADSKISFPAQFNGVDRKVLLSGEAYFAVRHDAKQPFRVESKGQVVEDIGTEFNINAYTDESTIKTTLVEGSASVAFLSPSGGEMPAGQRGVVLKPNQQATARGGKINIKTVDNEEFVAWKNGYFRFNDERITNIMRVLARWYQIDVQFEGEISDEGFNGTVSRNKNISQALKILERTKAVSFKVTGNKVYVYKNNGK